MNRDALQSGARGVATFAALQLGWFACVLGAAHGRPWLGPAVVGALIAVHLAASAAPARELATLAAFGALGTVADSLQGASGLLAFHGAATAGALAGMAPPWIAALWVHFATSLRGPLRALDRRPLVAAALGALAAPPSYLAGARLGAATLHPAVWPSLVSLGLEWALLLPLGIHLANRGSAPLAAATPGSAA